MVDLAPLFLRSMATGFLSDKPKDGGLKEWILSGNYGLSLGGVSETVLTGIASADLYPYLLFDYGRFAMASRESAVLSFKKPFDRRATAWPLINRYYSSFFAAHALLRVHGRGVTWLEASEANQLTAVGKLYLGSTFNVSKGGYTFEFDGQAYNGSLKLAPISFGGGSHDDFWKYFHRYLSQFGNNLLKSNAPNATQAIARLGEMQKLIIVSGYKGAWPSFMRNEINYQHRFGTWFPFKFSSNVDFHDKAMLKLINAAANLTADPNKQSLQAFNSITCFLSSLNKDIADLVKVRAGKGAKRFQSEWDRLDAAMKA